MRILIAIFFFLLFSFLSTEALALDCTKAPDKDTLECKFGTISPPPAIKDFTGTDKTGAAGISKFLSNFVALIYVMAAIVLVFMLLWGAFNWIISGGDKEKLESARNRILHAIIGIILFAAAFAVIQVLGTFTGFKFFTTQQEIQERTRILHCDPGERYDPKTDRCIR